ncbi:oxidoreductase [Streptomyces sp. NPDC005574]|uniref:oxidoreductase n=1 Tax=Streptomyces sp. NPDC005574 TaxID=3156891 RepID=UPI0033BAF9D0
MSGAYATFALAPATRAGAVLGDGRHRSHRDFTDFVVDGRPLLFRLSDLDAVSPLTSDVPPETLTARIRELLLEADAPLPGRRHLVYGCPDCQDPACGAVTAVIARSGDDYVWRDFAWRSGAPTGPRLDALHGIGPFRFDGTGYRAALDALLDGPRTARRRVLLVGPRAGVLPRLAAALRTIGVGADIAPDTVDVPTEELRAYAAVAFDNALPAPERAAVRRCFARAGLDVGYADCLAPSVPLLVAQVEQALDPSPPRRRRLARLAAAGGAAVVEVTSACRVRLTVHRPGRLARAHDHDVLDGVLEPGRHRVALDGKAAPGRSYLVARTPESVLVAAVAR